MRLPVFPAKRHPDRLSTFVLTMGIVDAVMGGVSGHVSLLVLGMVLVGGAVALRWPRTRSIRRARPGRSPQRLLSEEASRPSLPLLMDTAKRT